MNEPILLYIQGIYKNDINKYVVNPACHNTEDSNYDTIPQKYEGLVKWPRRTNVLCGHHGLAHSNVPIFIPEFFSYYDDANISINIIKLLFCSFPCASAYITNKYFGTERDNKLAGLRYIYKIFTGTNINYIPVAPDKMEITAFGGSKASYTPQSYMDHVCRLIPPASYIIS